MDSQRSGRRAFLRTCGMAGTAMAGLAGSTTSAHAQETTSYSYDALGRLATSNTSGGPNNGVATGTCFDAAGNRTQYAAGAAGAPCTTVPNAMLAPTATQASVPAQPKVVPPTAPTSLLSAPLTSER